MARPVEIAVISGKGGTGKTVLTSSLATLTEGNVIADCDVDAPNLHLLMNPVQRKEARFYGHKIASVDPALCDDCGECYRLCRFGSVRQREKADGWSYSIEALSCEGCGICSMACPQKAVEMKPALVGSYFVSDSEFGPFVHATLAPARENTGKLVSTVRREAKRVAAAEHLGRIIIEGPPGIGCQAIACISGVSLAVVMTEPTIAGVHDFRRVLALTRCLEVESAVVINKHDLNPEVARDTEGLVADHGAPLLGRIPFSPHVNEALSDGTPIMDIPDRAVTDAIEEIADGVVKIVRDM
jgi:MinD superfamily P-loop ATPase